MALHNYWWLLIWLFLFGGISLAFIPRQEEYVLGERCVRWSWFAAIILVQLPAGRGSENQKQA